MNRDDGVLWLSLFSFVALCGLAIWGFRFDVYEPQSLRPSYALTLS